VSAAPIVEDLQVLEDRFRQFDSRFPSLSVEKFDLHTAPELLDHRVVVTVAHRAHRRHQSGVNGSLGERSRRELLGFKGSSQHFTIELALHVIAWLPETAGRELEETSTLDAR